MSGTNRSPYGPGAQSRRSRIRNAMLSGIDTTMSSFGGPGGGGTGPATEGVSGTGPPSATSRSSLDFNFDMSMGVGMEPNFSPNFTSTNSRLSFGSTLTSGTGNAVQPPTWNGHSHNMNNNRPTSSSTLLDPPISAPMSNASAWSTPISSRGGRSMRKKRMNGAGDGFVSNKLSGHRSNTNGPSILNAKDDFEEPGGVLANAIPPPNDVRENQERHETSCSDSSDSGMEAEKQKSNQNVSSQNSSDGSVYSLRGLIEKSLHPKSTTSSPVAAVFYASILYTKTQTVSDAFLYAKALNANNEKRRAIFVLDRAGLLSFETMAEREKICFDSEPSYVRLMVEAMILAAQCLATFGEWDEVTTLLEDACRYEFHIHPDEVRSSRYLETMDWKASGEEEMSILELAHLLDTTVENDDIHPISRICMFRGKAYDEASNPSRAAKFLKLALYIDVKCIEAWTYLCQRRLLTSEEENKLVNSLKFDVPGIEWMKDIFLARLSNWGMCIDDDTISSVATPIPASASPMTILPQHQTPQMSVMDTSSIHFHGTPSTPFEFQASNEGINRADAGNNGDVTLKQEVEEAFQNLHCKHDLSQSPDVLALAATRAYNAYNLPLALHYCQVLYEMDPLCPGAAGIQIATLTALGHKRPLFRLAHALVDADSKSATAWYAVGCYYYACGRYDLAQQHFWRATRLDPRSADCWISFGCAFASCDENDQANACFRTAQRLHSGSHYPMLYMGMEHLRTNNIPLAGHFLKSAKSMEKNDPLCWNELGVWAYRKKDWGKAIRYFVFALRLYVEADMSEKTSLSWSDGDRNAKEEKLKKPRFEFGQRDKTLPLSEQDCIDYCLEPFWEPTIFNLGQSYRKARQLHKATRCFKKCLALCPVSTMTWFHTQ